MHGEAAGMSGTHPPDGPEPAMAGRHTLDTASPEAEDSSRYIASPSEASVF